MTTEERESDYAFLLWMLHNANDIAFQRECYLHCVERFWDIYINDDNPDLVAIKYHDVLLKRYTDKFKIESYEA